MIKTFALNGVLALQINIEIQISPGLPTFIIVGLGDKAIIESRERIRSAIFSLGISLPAKRIVVNLSPANIPKEGTHYDLGIAVAILCEMKLIQYEQIANTALIGELSLNGDIVSVNGIIAYAFGAKQHDIKLIVPHNSLHEARMVCDNVLHVRSLRELIDHCNGLLIKQDDVYIAPSVEENQYIDFANIAGHDKAKRAIEIAVAGGHHICMIGKPGSGKSMLANAVRSILPPLNDQEKIEVSLIHSISGYGMVLERPFRSPHHTSSYASIIGGGIKCMPGEISLANCGILFLDELPEFSRQVLESLRQPMEDYKIEISRANYKKKYQAKFQLIAAMNPCACGSCDNIDCSVKYQKRISAPLKERFDITVAVNEFHYEKNHSETSAQIKERIIMARAQQKKKLNGQLTGPELLEIANIDLDAKAKLQLYCNKYNLSSRSYFRIIRLALTISYLNNANQISQKDILSALSYHSRIV